MSLPFEVGPGVLIPGRIPSCWWKRFTDFAGKGRKQRDNDSDYETGFPAA